MRFRIPVFVYNRNMKNFIKAKILMLCLMSFVFVFVWGCVSSSQLYVGKSVEKEDIVILNKGIHKDINWETFDFVVNFDYELTDDTLSVTGEGMLGEHYRAIYTHLKHFDAYMFQVDKDGYVLDTVRLPTLRMNRPDDVFTFTKILNVFPETTGLSFGYSGEVYEHEKSGLFFNPYFNYSPFLKYP